MPELKPGWQWVKFGNVVRLAKDRSANPLADGIERYVGLEHIEPGDLRIRSWGDIADGTTFTSRFRPGQVLFGKRRAYQRKVAVADFDGVCSGDIYVLESADPGRLLSELLPFICQTDAFFEHAVGTSAGSLSPRTNWASLADYEFALPPLEEQERVAGLLRAHTQAYQKYVELVDASGGLEISSYWQLTLGLDGCSRAAPEWSRGRPPGVPSIPANWNVVAVTSVARLESGHTPSRRVPDYWGGELGWISLGDVGALDRRDISTSAEYVTQLGIDNSAARVLPTGTVILSRTATVGRSAVMAVPMATSQDFVNFVCDVSKILPEYLYYYFRALKPYWLSIAEGGGVRTIYYPFFKEMEMPLPPIHQQRDTVEKLRAVEDSVWKIRERKELCLHELRRNISHILNNEVR